MCRHIDLLMYCLSVDKFKYHDKHVHKHYTCEEVQYFQINNKRLRKLFLSYLPQFELYSFLVFIGYEFIVIPFKNQLKISYVSYEMTLINYSMINRLISKRCLLKNIKQIK